MTDYSSVSRLIHDPVGADLARKIANVESDWAFVQDLCGDDRPSIESRLNLAVLDVVGSSSEGTEHVDRWNLKNIVQSVFEGTAYTWLTLEEDGPRLSESEAIIVIVGKEKAGRFNRLRDEYPDYADALIGQLCSPYIPDEDGVTAGWEYIVRNHRQTKTERTEINQTYDGTVVDGDLGVPHTADPKEQWRIERAAKFAKRIPIRNHRDSDGELVLGADGKPFLEIFCRFGKEVYDAGPENNGRTGPRPQIWLNQDGKTFRNLVAPLRDAYMDDKMGKTLGYIYDRYRNACVSSQGDITEIDVPVIQKGPNGEPRHVRMHPCNGMSFPVGAGGWIQNADGGWVPKTVHIVSVFSIIPAYDLKVAPRDEKLEELDKQLFG